MELRLTVAQPGASAPAVDAVVRCEPGTTVRGLRPALAGLLGPSGGSGSGASGSGGSGSGGSGSGGAGSGGAVWVDGVALADDHPVGVPPLLEGAVVCLGRPGGAAGREDGVVGGFLELHVVGGPDAGGVHRLAPGRHRIGRGRVEVDVCDPDVSRLHAELAVAPGGLTCRDLGSTNGTRVDGVDVGDREVEVGERSRVRVGGSTLQVRVPRAARVGPAATTAVDGLVPVNRVPRIAAAAVREEFRLPLPPPARTTPRLPLVALVMPMLVAVPLALLLRSPFYLAIGLVSPLLLLGNVVSDRVTGRKDHAARLAQYAADLALVEADVAAAVADEQADRRAAAPDCAELLVTATQRSDRLWERSPGTDEWLRLAVGTATQPSRVAVVDPADAAAPPGTRGRVVADVPVTVPLAAVGVLGVAGARVGVLGLARSVLGQLAVLHSPRDLRIVVLSSVGWDADASGGAGTEGDHETDTPWSWVGWLPHARPGGDLPAAAASLLGVGEHQVRRRVAELGALLDRRQQARRRLAPVDGGWHPDVDVVVVLDGAARLRAEPGVARLLADGPPEGVRVVCLDTDAARLPVECRATVVLGGEVATRVRVRVADDPPVPDAAADLAGARWAVRLARALAPLRDATPLGGAGASVPTGVRLLDLLDVDATSAEAVAAGWRIRPRSTSTPLGRTAAGAFGVDLAADGPHVLVAGTTGSGKSELLQSLVAGLAVANRPDELAFVLVDYKGGSAFAGCTGLPHVVGMVTDLDGATTARALESLRAEVTRRERLLAAAGATSLSEYQQTVDRTGPSTATPSLARLVLVVDEFRALATELPDLLSGLVRLAAVGRSLGVHLVLATQRPAGVVSADIRANVNLRIALRVLDAADSLDVVEVPDAARIDAGTPGRALARLGSAPPVPVQVARIGGTGTVHVPRQTWVRRLDGRSLGDPLPAPPPTVARPGPSDLRLLVDAVAAAATAEGVPAAPSPWLPALREAVTLAELAELAQPFEPAECVQPPGSAGLALPFALLDDPSAQVQRVAAWDLAAHGPLAVTGTSRSGRTSTVRAMLASMAHLAGPADACAYVLDGGGSLADVEALPNVAAVVDPADVERSDRLLRQLAATVADRQQALARAGVGDLAELRAAASAGRAGRPEAVRPGALPPPWVVVAVDGWEAVQRAWGDADGVGRLEVLQELLREGPRVGVLLVVTGGRSVLSGQLGASVGHRLVLRLADPADVVLAGLRTRDSPSPWPPGRAVLVGGAAGRHPRCVQVALLSTDPAGAVQRAAVDALARTARRAHAPLPTAASLRAMPLSVRPHEVMGVAGGSPDGRPTTWWALGLGGEDVTPVGVDVAVDGPALLVAGHPGSGRSTALLTIARSATAGPQGTRVVVVSPRPSPVRALAGTPDVVAVVGADDAEALQDALATAGAGGRPVLVLADDVEVLEGQRVEPVLQHFLAAAASAPPGTRVLAAAGSSSELLVRFSGIAAQVRRPCCGLLLGPAGPLDGDLFSVRLPRRTERLPGRGFLVSRGRLVPVQVALAQVAATEAPRRHEARHQADSPARVVPGLVVPEVVVPAPVAPEVDGAPRHAS